MASSKRTLNRRAFLSGAIGAGVLLGGMRNIRLLFGESPAQEHRFVSCYFNGGWDVLLGPDARDPAVSYDGLDLGTELLAPQYRDPIPVMVGGREILLGAPMASLARHADALALFRGVNMNTVAHPTGRAYVNTYIQPAGVSARGSSLATTISSQGDLPKERILPNVSIGVPSFNTGYGPEFTGVGLQNGPEIMGLLRHEATPLPTNVEDLLSQAQDASQSCVSDRYPGPRPADQLRVVRQRVRQLLSEDVGRHFDLAADSAAMMDLRARYGFNKNLVTANPRDPRIAAATAGQLIRTGLARSVTVQIQQGLDSHANWAAQQPVRLQAGSNALAVLLDDLRADDPGMLRTTVIACSEFARTPRLNGRQGRDHWFSNSMMVFGAALKTGVYGATREDNLGLMKVDLASGLPDEEGTIMKPEHIAASLVSATGGDPLPFRVSPVSAWIGASA